MGGIGLVAVGQACYVTVGYPFMDQFFCMLANMKFQPVKVKDDECRFCGFAREPETERV